MELYEYEKKHLSVLREHLAECTVLLKSNGKFPIKNLGKISLYGNGARHTVKGGTGSGEVNSRFFTTVEDGIAAAGFEITTTKWLDAYDDVLKKARKHFIKEIKDRAKKNHTVAIIEGLGTVMPEPEFDIPLNGDGEVVIYCLSRTSGEGNDRNPTSGDIFLSNSEIRDIKALNEKYDSFLLVLNVGGIVDLTPVADVKNILLLSQLGVETGAVLADIITGKKTPSGKLTTTWSAWGDYCKIGEFGNKNDTRYNEGIYVGYRYFDTAKLNPLFPFGYGLSYTKFDIKVQNAQVEKDSIIINANVKNIGDYPGKEVVQIYLTPPEGMLDKPYQALAAWGKTQELKPGENQKLKLKFKLSDNASYDTNEGKYILEKGQYIIRIGNNSRDTLVSAIVKLDDTICVRQVKNCLGTPDFDDYRIERKTEENNLFGIPQLEILASNIDTEIITYDGQAEIDPIAEKLTDDELAYFNIGAFNPNGGILSIIGNASSKVAGAAGETYELSKEKCIPAMVMADGPAGLRISQHYTKDEKGIHAVGETAPSSTSEFLPAPVRILNKLLMSKPKKGAKIYDQYATAIPVGTAIAQSWNLQFAQDCGDIVGDEMERFGIHLWLAPALNIHRNIRCGRNFEYYSEDPLISGKFAAAITIGVQKHKGCGTTIKHFVANNQETNRYNNNSIVSERALREIYLKGFEICIKESHPYALMTSYNLLNGIHTSERSDLMEDVLRTEFGYKGIIMTDWLIAGGTVNKNSVHQAPCAWKAAKAGNNLYMPGSKADFDDVVAALKNNLLDREKLKVSASYVMRVAKKLAE